MDRSVFAGLPDELIESILYYLPPRDTVAFGASCRRASKITAEPLLWRRHCIKTWRFWESRHDLQTKLREPPTQVRWRRMFEERQATDKQALELFNALLQGHQHRIRRIETIARFGSDVRDLLTKIRYETPEDAPDVLARRYFAMVILEKICRFIALQKWLKVYKREMVRLEDVTAAYDMFVLGGRHGDLEDIEKEFDRLADLVRTQSSRLEEMSTRQKAIRIAEVLQTQRLVGNSRQEDYHDLRNNFISMSLFEEPHSALPLQCVIIYCAVARRLDVNARPSNYPSHVHAVIEAPRDVTLDGRPRTRTPDDDQSEPERMHMDPWRSSQEVSQGSLRLRLTQMGVPDDQHNYHLGPSSNLEVTIRIGRNIMNSVQEDRRQAHTAVTDRGLQPDVENAWYSILWATMITGDFSSIATMHRRRQFLPYLIGHYEKNRPEDVDLIENFLAPMFVSDTGYEAIMDRVKEAREGDQNDPVPKCRPQNAEQDVVQYRVGSYLRHKRYGYHGVIIGWDQKCDAGEGWIEQMRVDRSLKSGRLQPFYNVLADDNSYRYVAEENIEILTSGEPPSENLLLQAGLYFKRWDVNEHRFVSNVRDKLPDD